MPSMLRAMQRENVTSTDPIVRNAAIIASRTVSPLTSIDVDDVTASPTAAPPLSMIAPFLPRIRTDVFRLTETDSK